MLHNHRKIVNYRKKQLSLVIQVMLIMEIYQIINLTNQEQVKQQANQNMVVITQLVMENLLVVVIQQDLVAQLVAKTLVKVNFLNNQHTIKKILIINLSVKNKMRQMNSILIVLEIRLKLIKIVLIMPPIRKFNKRN